MKYLLRKTMEEVDVIAFSTSSYGERSINDWVSYIDKNNVEHIKGNLSIDFDFIKRDSMEDIWKQRKYDIVKSLLINNGYTIDRAISVADNVISRLK